MLPRKGEEVMKIERGLGLERRWRKAAEEVGEGTRVEGAGKEERGERRVYRQCGVGMVKGVGVVIVIEDERGDVGR